MHSVGIAWLAHDDLKRGSGLLEGLQLRRTPVQVSLDHRRLELTVHREGAGGPIQVGVGDDVRELCPGDTETFGLSPAVAAGGRESRV